MSVEHGYISKRQSSFDRLGKAFLSHPHTSITITLEAYRLDQNVDEIALECSRMRCHLYHRMRVHTLVHSFASPVHQKNHIPS